MKQQNYQYRVDSLSLTHFASKRERVRERTINIGISVGVINGSFALCCSKRELEVRAFNANFKLKMNLVWAPIQQFGNLSLVYVQSEEMLLWRLIIVYQCRCWKEEASSYLNFFYKTNQLAICIGFVSPTKKMVEKKLN